MALKAVAGGTGRVREGVRTQGGASTPPAPPPTPADGLPDPGAGMAYLTDAAGTYLVASNGAYLIGAA